jgi:hypothetical protein
MKITTGFLVTAYAKGVVKHATRITTGTVANVGVAVKKTMFGKEISANFALHLIQMCFA